MIINGGLFLGIDLGTSGVRLVILNEEESLLYSAKGTYELGLEEHKDWKNCLENLIVNIPVEYKKKLIACSVDGTSGTLVATDKKGNCLGKAIPYYDSCNKLKEEASRIINNENNSLNDYSSLSRALHLTKQYGDNILLRHQADWTTGWLLNNWDYGEEGNNIRLGWDLENKSWANGIKTMKWFNALPKIISSGNQIGIIASSIAGKLNLPKNLKIIAGTTDSNAAVLAASPSLDEGISVLGSTIVVKRFVSKPIKGLGITNHLVGGQWLCGGASNAGGAVLSKFFSPKDLIELSRQINPELNSGLKFLPLATKGERFPIYDPELQPILHPRPISDSLYLHGILEGLAQIEAKGWSRLSKLIGNKPKKIITIGGGASNPQWRRIRERIIGIPIKTSSKQPAEGVARLAMRSIKNSTEKCI